MVARLIKSYLPRSLFGRAALIYLVPMLTILGVMLVVFIQRLYEDVTRQMTMGVVDEIALVLNSFTSGSDAEAALTAAREIADPLAIDLVLIDAPTTTKKGMFDLSGVTINATVQDAFPSSTGVDLVSYDQSVGIGFLTEFGPLRMDIRRNRFSARNPHQFLVLIGLTALVMTLVALLYLRGQVRPIRRLAAAATAFGKGRMLQYQPSGAAEVREAGRAFLEMRDRIDRQIEQRTLMLSGVSHDLRTPLTRMRLALSLLDDPDGGSPIAKDLDEMDRMLNAFLDFAKSEALDDPEMISPAKIAHDAIEKAARSGHAVTAGQIDQADEMELRPMALSRALDNLIGNAIQYATKARVSFRVDDSSVRFVVEDDGPGIAAADREVARKPFSRLDQSRNQDAGSGVGLGLAIASDIARQHGGQLHLGESASLGGLRAEISIPR